MKKLLGKPVAEKIINQLKDFDFWWKYLAIFLLSDDEASSVYVNHKVAFWEKIWVQVRVLLDNYSSIEKLLHHIDILNSDENCGWIIVQLPLPKKYKPFEAKILSSIDKKKDVDWLGYSFFADHQLWENDFLPATASAIFELLDFYNLWKLKWKTVSIIGQSNLVWKPINLECIAREATTFCFNQFSDQENMKKICQMSDYIISCTWVPQLINQDFLSWKNNQILIDVGYARKYNFIVWDMDYENIKNQVEAITPVPGGVWPITVASLFKNMAKLIKLQNTWNNN